jgi:hypothetical protein
LSDAAGLRLGVTLNPIPNVVRDAVTGEERVVDSAVRLFRFKGGVLVDDRDVVARNDPEMSRRDVIPAGKSVTVVPVWGGWVVVWCEG